MNEAAWCYLEGFGCKKDKVRFLLGSRSNHSTCKSEAADSRSISSLLRGITGWPRRTATRRWETHGKPVHFPAFLSALCTSQFLGMTSERSRILIYYVGRIWKDKYGPPDEPATGKK